MASALRVGAQGLARAWLAKRARSQQLPANPCLVAALGVCSCGPTPAELRASCAPGVPEALLCGEEAG
eukprot:5546535-Alexandrium_andersonii.AAC.1